MLIKEGGSMNTQKDLKENWDKTRKQLIEFSQEAMKLAKEGEKRAILLSKQGKLHLDSTTLGVKKEHMFYLIGKEYVKAKCPGTQTAKLKKLIKEFHEIEKKQRTLKSKIKRKK